MEISKYFSEAYGSIVLHGPKVLAALIILVMAVIAAKFLQQAVRYLAGRSWLNKYLGSETSSIGDSLGAAVFWIVILTIAALVPSHANAQARLQAGVLVCAGDGDWSTTINSNKRFQCTFSSTNGEVRGKYSAEIQDFSAAVGKSGNTVLMWLVFGPREKIGENYEPGRLEGTYIAAGVDSPKDMEFSADTLVGMGPRSFALQPISVQVQTGLSIATGVNTLVLSYSGPIVI